MTWTPASSRARAQAMLVCSSNRACSSTTAVTCLPAREARIRAATIGLSAPVRYRVCLMASTSGSSAAAATKASTEPLNDS